MKPSPRAAACQLGVLAIVLAGGLLAGGCQWGGSGTAANREVVVYTALDQEFSQPIFEAFTQETGIQVLAKYDVESTKTVGLTQAIIAEANRPRCDVFWNNEVLHTLRLEQLGLLRPYASPAGAAFPPEFRSPQGLWHGFAARARVLLVNTRLVPEASRPKSILDLAQPQFRGQCGLAKPLFGTTATHAACLFAALGPEQAQDFFRRAKANQVQILSGNKQVALAVAGGQLSWGLTDTDDALIELERGQSVAIVYPDQEEGQLGTLFIPNSLALIQGGQHAAEAQQLVDYLLSPAVEERLARSASAQIPLNPAVTVPLRTETPRTVRAMQVDFAAAAQHWEAAGEFLRQEFAGP